MTSLIFSLVFLSITLVLADFENDYILVSKQRDSELVRSYYYTQDPLSLRLLWEQFEGRALYLLEVGKQKAIEQADISQVEKIKKEWNAIKDMGTKGTRGQDEIKKIIDSLRSRALVKAPHKWDQVAKMAVNLEEDFKKAALEANIESVKKVMLNSRKSFRKINDELSAVLDA